LSNITAFIFVKNTEILALYVPGVFDEYESSNVAQKRLLGVDLFNWRYYQATIKFNAKSLPKLQNKN